MGLYQQMKRKLDNTLVFEEKNTALIMLEAVFAGIVLQLTNPFYQLFASAMGADEVAIGLISSLPAFCALFVLLPASLMMDRVKEKKKFLMTTITICGVILPLVAMSPFLGDRGYWFFIIGISVWNAPYLCYTVSWQSYFSDLYPANNRALPYSRRQMVYNAVPVVTIMMGGAVQSYLCHTTEQKILAFQIFYFIAFGAAMLQRKMIEKTELPAYAQNKAAGEKQSIGKLVGEFVGAVKALRKHPQFCIFLALLFCFYFSWQLAWPMFFLFLVTENGINEVTKSIFDVASYLATTLTSTWWGRRIDRRGVRGATILGMLGCAAVPAWTVASTNFWILLGSYIFSGATAPGFQLGLFNDMLENLPEENKSLYIGIYNLVMQISNFVAPLCGVALYTRIGTVATMRLSSCLRLVAASLFAVRFVLGRKQKKANV